MHRIQPIEELPPVEVPPELRGLSIEEIRERAVENDRTRGVEGWE